MFRWIALIGDGGMGKTRLAMRFADSSLEESWLAGFLAEDEARGIEELFEKMQLDEGN